MPPHIPDAPPDSAPPSTPERGTIRRFSSMGRRRTQPSDNLLTGLRKNPSFATIARQNTEASLLPKGPKLEKDTCSAYGLAWGTLEGFLVNKFPGYTFKEITLKKDVYIFDVPESLSMDDHKAIDLLRENAKTAVEARSSESPEPGAT